jgi:hypothetical protein
MEIEMLDLGVQIADALDAAHAKPESSIGISRVDLKAEKPTELTQITAYHPTWSRNGKYVYFSSTEQGEPALYSVVVKDHKLKRVVSLKDVKRPTSASWGNWTGLDPDDAPLALRDISRYEIYALDWQLP